MMKTENEDVKHLYTKEFKQKLFGEGEWVDEPDIIKFEYRGYKCLVFRVVKKDPFATDEHYFGGHLCGYVLLSEGHKFYGKNYDEIDVDCHGGLTFSEFSDDYEEFDEFDIDRSHLIGFDCAHSGDYCPSSEEMMKKIRRRGGIYAIPEEFKKYSIFNPVYRNVQFCVDECKSIVDQLINKGVEYEFGN